MKFIFKTPAVPSKHQPLRLFPVQLCRRFVAACNKQVYIYSLLQQQDAFLIKPELLNVCCITKEQLLNEEPQK